MHTHTHTYILDLFEKCPGYEIMETRKNNLYNGKRK